MKLSFGNMTSELNIFNVIKHPGEEEEICEVDEIDEIVEEKINTSFYSDPLQVCLINSVVDSGNPDVQFYADLLNSSQEITGNVRNFTWELKPD